MNSIDLHHRSAMHYAEIAMASRGDLALQMYHFALEHEVIAAEGFTMNPDNEPSRSVLYRSAACLALRAGEPFRARKLAHEGINSFTPKEIEAELRAVLETADKAIEKTIADNEPSEDEPS